MKKLITTLALTSMIVVSGTMGTAPTANAEVCTTAICSPNSDGVIDMRRPFTSTPPVTVCEILNNPVVDVVVQIVGGLLKVKWVVTLVPTLVCRLI
jgi:hypothetical protein